MKITIEIPDEEIKEAVLKVVAEQYYRNYSSDRHNANRIVSECVRKVIYEDKERITDRRARRMRPRSGTGGHWMRAA